MAKRRYFELVNESSSKFWEISLDGNKVVTRYGKIGSAGQTTVKDEGSAEKALDRFEKLVREKTGKGYAEQTSPIGSTMHSESFPPGDSPPRTSSRQVVSFLKGKGLAAEFDEGASDDFEAVFGALLSWYSEPTRATPASVFALRHEEGASTNAVFSSSAFRAFSDVLEQWLHRKLPPLEGGELIGYVADALMIDAHHSETPETSPQLLALESEIGTLYLLRSVKPGHQDSLPEEGWELLTLNSPDTEAALNGIYRFEGCTPAFADHAAGCSRCQGLLQQWEAKADLPDGFERFRRQPLRPQPQALPDLPPVSGVGIVIPRATRPESEPEPQPTTTAPVNTKPWWKLW